MYCFLFHHTENLLDNQHNIQNHTVEKQTNMHLITFTETTVCLHHPSWSSVSQCFSFSLMKLKCHVFGQVAQFDFTPVKKLWDGCRGNKPQTVVTWCLKATCCCCFCMLHIFQTQELWEIVTAAAGQMTLVIFSSFSISFSSHSPNPLTPPPLVLFQSALQKPHIVTF